MLWSIALLWAVTFGLLAVATPANFPASLQKTLVHEGGSTYTNHPADPGGPTKYGITIHDVRLYLKPGATAQDVKNLTLEEASIIYKVHYWDAVKGDELPPGLDYSVFDYAVNAGTGRAIPALRQCIAKYSSAVEQQITCVNIEKRMTFQMGLGSSFDVFKRGWRNRINSVEAGAQVMYKTSQGVKRGYFETDPIPRLGRGKAY